MIDDLIEIPKEYRFVREPWRDQAACVDLNPDMFHPERGEPTEPAKAICFGCPVSTECLTWALDNFVKIGVYGGRSERERRRMRHERRAAARRGVTYVIRPIDTEPRLPSTVASRPRLRVARFDSDVRRAAITIPRRRRVARFDDLAAVA